MTAGSILLAGGFFPDLGTEIVENPLVAMSLTRCCKTNSLPNCMELEVSENMVQDLEFQMEGTVGVIVLFRFKRYVVSNLLVKRERCLPDVFQ